MASLQKHKRPYKDFDTENDTHIQADNFPKFLIIKSTEEKPFSFLSPFIIEKQTESLIGTPKTVKKLKNQTILIETSRKAQSDWLLKIKNFFDIKVFLTKHKTLNTSKRIIKIRTLKGATEEDILNYLAPQEVIAVKRFKIKKRPFSCKIKYHSTHIQLNKTTIQSENLLPNYTCRTKHS